MTMRRRTLLVLLSLAVLVGATACGGGGDDDGGESGDAAEVTTTTDDGDATTNSSTTTTSTTSTAGEDDGDAFPPPVTAPLPSRGEPMADGVHAVFLEGTDVDGGEIVVDVVQFLTGEEANRAYREETGDQGDVPNDFFIRNASQDQRSVKVSTNAKVTVAWDGNEVRAHDIALADLPAYLQSRDAEGNDRALFWVAVEYEIVTRLYEQYLP